MQLTARDVQLVRDIALSHVLSRDQVLGLGYFATVTRVNTRLRELASIGAVKVLETPFFAQHLYGVGPRAEALLGERISRIVAGRTGSPRFLQHALTVTNVRIALKGKGLTEWRFEQQVRAAFTYQSRAWDVRPDGLVRSGDNATAVEVDLRHVTPSKIKEKLDGYQAFARSGDAGKQWQVESFRLLLVTTGTLRASRLRRLAPPAPAFDYRCVTLADLGITPVGGWS